MSALLATWQRRVLLEGRFLSHRYERFRPVACDLVGFFRPHLVGCPGKHYTSQADKALPAVVVALVAAVGTVGTCRLALPRLLLRQKAGETEASLQRRAVREANAG